MSEDKRDLFPENEVAKSELYQVLRGESVKELFLCVDSLLASLARRRMGVVETVLKDQSPFCVQLGGPSSPATIFLSPIKGIVENIVLYCETSAKSFELQITRQEGNEAKTIKIPIVKGFNTISTSFELNRNALISGVYFLKEGETCSAPIISFTFRGLE